VRDPIITLRRDRYVIPIKASAQSRVPGIVLDVSDSGQTVFVEPASVVPLNNELAVLELEERDEVRRILIALAQRLAFDPGLEPTLEALAELDLVVASARLARDWSLVRPTVADGAPLSLPAARHPLVEGCVPNDVELDEEARVLIVTGPNAGGKTVLLKTVGLAVLMAHAGLFVAAGRRRRDGAPRRASVPRLRQVLTDIGDEQSIEASLSTYAGHLTNLHRVVEESGPDTLVLIDELGSGTDPDEGAALSQAILEEVLRRRAFALVTTHLAPLKAFASGRPGIRNAAMRFDVDALAPTFELVVGQPGRSYALAIARRIGLGEPLLERAAALLGPEGERLERLLESLEAQRETLQRELDEARAAAEEARRDAAVLREQIEGLREREAELLAHAAEKADEMLKGTLQRATELRRTAATDPEGAARRSRRCRRCVARRVRSGAPLARRGPAGARERGARRGLRRQRRGGRGARRRRRGAARPPQGRGAAARGAAGRRWPARADRATGPDPGGRAAARARAQRARRAGRGGDRAGARLRARGARRQGAVGAHPPRQGHGSAARRRAAVPAPGAARRALRGRRPLRGGARRDRRLPPHVSECEQGVPAATAGAGRPPAVVFDLDGTLVDSLPDILASFAAAFAACGLAAPAAQELRSHVGWPLEEIFACFAEERAVAALTAAYREHYPRTFTTHSRPFPGVPEVLAELRRRGFRLAIATTKRTEIAVRFVAAMGLAELVDHVQGTDGFPHKPAPDVVLRALAAVGGRGTWMVGDTVHDVAAGRAAGLSTYALTWGTHDAERLREERPDVLADSIEPLLDAVSAP
jgi:phosphoglycolate phosphatase-like HAD superfamily hydrolase